MQRQRQWGGRASTRSRGSVPDNSGRTCTSRTNSCNSCKAKWRYSPLCCQTFRFDLSTGVTHVSRAAVPSQGDGTERRGGILKTTETGAAIQHSTAGRGQPDTEGGNTATQRQDAETSESCFAFLSLCEATATFESAVISRQHSEHFFSLNFFFSFPRWHQWEPWLHDAEVSTTRGNRATADAEEGLSGGGATPSHAGETPTQRRRGREEV